MAIIISLTITGATYSSSASAYIVDDPSAGLTISVSASGQEGGSQQAGPRAGTEKFRVYSDSGNLVNTISGAGPHTYHLPGSGKYRFEGQVQTTHDAWRSSYDGRKYTSTPPDNTPPTISGPAYPASEVNEVSGQTYVKGSTVTVTYTASDSGGSGLAGIWIDGVQASSSGSASKTYTVTSDFTSSAYSRDGEGNQSGTVSKAFKYDNIAPTISNFIVNSATTPVSGQDIFVDYPNTTCDFEFTATDNESGLKSYKATNASGVDTTGSLSGASQTITLSHDLNEANSSKEIKYELEVEDKAGNISTQSSPIVIVDDTPPTGTLAIDSSQTTNVVDGVTYIKTSDVKLSITKSDSESGLF